MDLIEDLIIDTNQAVGNSCKVSFLGQVIDLTKPWKRVKVREALLDITGINLDTCTDIDSMRSQMKKAGISIQENPGYGGILEHARLLDVILDKYVVPSFSGPTFLYEYPFYLGGPAKEVSLRPNYKMRSELFVAGVEIANISTPQNNPEKMRAWYNEMLRLKCEKGWDSPYLDKPYLSSMSIGIPLAATGGLGFDRLLMLLTDAKDIHEVRLFESGAKYEVQGK
jgi:lysyl-tRNA synthetase class 2